MFTKFKKYTLECKILGVLDKIQLLTFGEA